MDFLSDQLFNGRRIRILTIADAFSRLSPAIDVRPQYRGTDVVETLERVAGIHGMPWIAHREPVFARNLIGDHGRILELTGWISPAIGAWIDFPSRVPSLLQSQDKPNPRYF